MKLSSFILGTVSGLVVIAVVLLVFGVVSFQRPLDVQGAALYNSSEEISANGTVSGLEDFTCPVGEHEVGSHLMLTTSGGVLLVHLAPSRIMRSQSFTFQTGDKLEVVGAKFRFHGEDGLIAREITRGNETYVIRGRDGKLLLVQ